MGVGESRRADPGASQHRRVHANEKRGENEVLSSRGEIGNSGRRTLVARKGEPPRSGWLRIISFRCTFAMVSLSAPLLQQQRCTVSSHHTHENNTLVACFSHFSPKILSASPRLIGSSKPLSDPTIAPVKCENSPPPAEPPACARRKIARPARAAAATPAAIMKVEACMIPARVTNTTVRHSNRHVSRKAAEQSWMTDHALVRSSNLKAVRKSFC